MKAVAATTVVEAVVKADRRDSGARGGGGDADGGNDGRVPSLSVITSIAFENESRSVNQP